MTIDEINQELKRISKPKISIPEIRKLAKKVAKDDYEYFLENSTLETLEQKLLHAFVIGYVKDDIKVLMKYFEDFIPHVDDWAVNDALCQNFKIAKKYPEEVFEMLMKHKDSNKDFEVRVVSVMLLSHYLVDDYIDRTLDVLNHLHTVDYYSRMGVAWAIATAMAKDKYPEKVKKYMESKDNQLDDWTYNKSLQKMRESFRVSDEIKEWTRTVKK